LKIKNLTRQQKRVTETQQGQKGTKKLNAVKGQAKQQQNKTLNNNKKTAQKQHQPNASRFSQLFISCRKLIKKFF
jgi:hypothetical protein